MDLKVEDIARMASVSKTAVSFALNNKPGISDETRGRILNIVKEHGYVSKTLIKSEELYAKTNTIILLNCSRTQITSVDFGTTPFFSELVNEVEKSIKEFGYDLWLRSIHVGDDFQNEVSMLLSNRNISGILLMSTDMFAEDVEFICSLNKNIVAMDGYFDYLDVDCVVMDNFQGAYTAANYLMDFGHTEIGYIQSVNRINNFSVRKAGFEAALRKKGISLDVKNILEVIPTIDDSTDNLKQLFKKRDKFPTAFFAENDYIAIGAIRCLQSVGIKVPDDISILGFDNISVSSLISPALTTIDVPKGKMASLSVERLINKINSNDSNFKVTVAVKLIERNSCKSILNK